MYWCMILGAGASTGYVVTLPVPAEARQATGKPLSSRAATRGDHRSSHTFARSWLM
jgi:hypothetical protein